MKTKSIITVMLTTLVLLCSNQTLLAQIDLSKKADLTETEKQLIYSRAFEAILWGSPALAVYAQHEANQRDLGAHQLDIIYSGLPMDYRWGGLTYNNQSPYFISNFSLKDGPIVVEFPPASPEARVFGSIHDVWQIALEDFGPAGADKGEGGKYLVLPPGYKGSIPDGYIVLHSPSYVHYIIGRTIPRDKGQKGWDAAVAYLQNIKLYPLANPNRPTKFVQGAQKKYDAQPMFDLNDFRLLDRIVQEEPIQERDKVMLGMLISLGIERGKKFDPSPEVAAILEKAAKDVQAYAIEKIQSGETFRQFWPDRGWGVFKMSDEYVASLGSANYDRALLYEYRMMNHFYYAGGFYRRFDPNKPVATAYVMTAKDGSGKPLDATKTYKFNIPKDVPMKDFWSIMLYGCASRTFLNSPKFTLSSNDEGLKVNTNGSIDLYLSPKPVEGFEANTVITNPKEDAFLMFRFYGAEKELWDLKWKLGDPVLVK